MSRNLDRCLVKLHRQWLRRSKQDFHYIEASLNFVPRASLLMSPDIHELIEHLHTDDAACLEQRICLFAAGIVCTECVNDYVGIQKRLIGHLPPLGRI